MSASTTTKLKLKTQPVKPGRRRFKETTITTAATSSPYPMSSSVSTASHGSAMDGDGQELSFASSFSKFNSALTAGLLNPMSPPPPPQLDNKIPIRSSPTLFEMMSNDVSNGDFLAQSSQRSDLATTTNGVVSSQYHHQRSNLSTVSNGVLQPQTHQRSNQSMAIVPNGVFSSHDEKRSDRSPTLALNGLIPPQNHQTPDFLVKSSGEAKQALIQQRLSEILAIKTSLENWFNDSDSGDLKLTLSSKDGVSVDVSVHKQILVAHSRYFESKLSEKWITKQEASKTRVMEIEIADCEDLEVYVETLRLMYCKDLRRRLMKENVDRVLGILKISAAIGFDAGILSCLEYLEAAPWSEDEEEEISSLLSQLQLEGIGAEGVLRRIYHESTSDLNRGSDNEQLLLKLLQAVLEGKDEKARREMKALVTKMLRESASQNDLRKESLYITCDNCLNSLRGHFLRAAENSENSDQIAKQADNLHWLLDILIDRQFAEDFLNTWASLSELSKAHCKVPVMHRFEISGITARFFVAIGKRQMLASKESRCMLLQTWLVPFYEDFRWMKRASKGLDRNLIEVGLSNTISTLPLNLQQEILMSWFDRYLNSGEDCPNLQRAFEVWWRRAFLKRERTSQMRIVKAENS